jgi:hypothetical protein
VNEDLNWTYRRWRTAEEEGRDDDADGAFKAVFETAVSAPDVAPAFTAKTMQAVAAVAVTDARRARRTRKALVAGGVAAALVTAYYGAALAASALVGIIKLLVGATVEAATRVQSGAGVWSLLVSLGRAAAAFIAEPEVTFVIIAIHGIAIAALYAMHRLLGSDEESFQ